MRSDRLIWDLLLSSLSLSTSFSLLPVARLFLSTQDTFSILVWPSFIPLQINAVRKTVTANANSLNSGITVDSKKKRAEVTRNDKIDKNKTDDAPNNTVVVFVCSVQRAEVYKYSVFCTRAKHFSIDCKNYLHTITLLGTF